MDERQITDQQRAHPRGATEFVRADGDHVGLGKRQLSSRLRAIGKDEAALLPDNGTQRVQRLDHAGFVIHVRSEEHTYELQSLMRISYAVCCLKKTTAEHRPAQNQSRITTHYHI